MFLRSCTSGLYVVTKGSSLSLIFCFSPYQCLESRLTPDNDLSISGLGYSCASSSQGTLQMYVVFFYGLFSNQSYFFAFNETSFYLQRVERGKVCILKGFSRLIVHGI